MTSITLTPEPVFEEGQGPFAPEILAGPVFSRRHVGQRSDGKHALVTDYYGVVDLRLVFPDREDCFDGHPYDVQEYAELILTTDPENLDDVEDGFAEYEWPSNRSFTTIEQATEYARRCAEFSSPEFFHVADVA